MDQKVRQCFNVTAAIAVAVENRVDDLLASPTGISIMTCIVAKNIFSLPARVS